MMTPPLGGKNVHISSTTFRQFSPSWEQPFILLLPGELEVKLMTDA